jgi:L-lactate dehydrogenase complex protein LldE
MSDPPVSKSVHLFHTCLVNEIDPDVGMAVVRVLERAGVAVNVPSDQTCCGQPAYNAGFHDEARQVARHTLQLLSQTRGPIVIPSGSCADMLVHQYAVLFQDDRHLLETARTVAKRCREFSQYLAEIAPRGVGGKLPACVAYHPSCHLLRGLGVKREPTALINAVAGARQADVREPEECCGFGGLFSIKNADISSAMLERKIVALEASGADRLVSCDLGCLLHLSGGLHRRGSRIRAQHLAQFLDEAHSPDKM